MKIFQRGICKRTNLINSVGLSANPIAYFPAEGVHEPEGLFDANVGLETAAAYYAQLLRNCEAPSQRPELSHAKELLARN